MLSQKDFIRLLNIEINLIKMQTEGLELEDALIQPQPSGNCMNWVLGHLLENQIEQLELLGAESPVERSLLTVYQRDSEPLVGECPEAWQLPELVAGLEEMHSALVARLGQMSAADFEREVIYRDKSMTVGWRFLFNLFHYTYHLGQLEQLRQLAGRTEKLI
ncbi:MAG: DinB family protein [Anaerolineales bacterium]|jgi:hypothetical protein|nr:DinB family protein [Anaerolineales bacterium]